MTLLRALIVAGLVLLDRSAIAQTPALDGILDAASRYVNEFVTRFANVVAEERYLQETSSSAPLRGGSRRELRSDFLLVALPESTISVPLRDVFEVDGSPVRDREQRLTRLMLQKSPGALEQARRIAAESARYNLGDNVKRTLNNPLSALAFLQPDHRTRFQFELDRRDAVDGAEVWIVRYRERARPTFIKGAYDKDLPAQGRYWIDVATGRVARTELNLEDASVSARLVTDFRVDDRFKIDVPVRMSERYRLTGGRDVSGVATYGRFRRFDISTEELIK